MNKKNPSIPLSAGRLSSSHLDALGALGHAYLRHQQADKARVLFAALTALAPARPQFYLSLAWASLAEGGAEKTLALTAPALARVDHWGEAAREMHAHALLRLGRTNDARRLLKEGRTHNHGELQ